MTPQRLAEIRERAERATAGPWQQKNNPAWGKKLNVEPAVAFFQREEDAEFSAHSRQDIPDLLAYIGELHHALQLAEWVQPTCAQCGNLISQGHENGCIYRLIGGSGE